MIRRAQVLLVTVFRQPREPRRRKLPWLASPPAHRPQTVGESVPAAGSAMLPAIEAEPRSRFAASILQGEAAFLAAIAPRSRRRPRRFAATGLRKLGRP